MTPGHPTIAPLVWQWILALMIFFGCKSVISTTKSQGHWDRDTDFAIFPLLSKLRRCWNFVKDCTLIIINSSWSGQVIIELFKYTVTNVKKVTLKCDSLDTVWKFFSLFTKKSTQLESTLLKVKSDSRSVYVYETTFKYLHSTAF